MNYELAFGLRISALEKRMDAVEASKTKRKADVLAEDSDDDVELVADDESAGEGEGEGAGEGAGGDFETILKGVLRHSKPATDFEWARKQLNLVQTDPADLDRYFTALIQSLVICGYVDSFTAWLNRFVTPVSAGLLKPRNAEAYVMKNLLVLMNLQPVARGKQGKEVAHATLKKRSTYDKVIGLARRVARGETLTYEPSPAALQLQACPPKKARAAAGAGGAGSAGAGAAGAGRKKKLFAQKPMEESESEDDEAEDEAEVEAGEEMGKSALFPMGKGKGFFYGMLAGGGASGKDDEDDEDEAEKDEEAEMDEDEEEKDEDAAEDEEAEEKDEEEEEKEKDEEEADAGTDDLTQVQPATQPVVTVELKKVDLLAEKPSSSEVTDFFMPQPAAAPAVSSSGVGAGGAGASDLRSRFMAKKILSSSSSSSSAAVPVAAGTVQQHPMMAESAPMEWEPLDVNRRSMVQTSTDALDSYLNWRKAFEADPRFENRYTEYTRPNGERSTLTGYYVRFFTAWPCVVVSSPEEVASMDARQVDTIYVRWLSTLSKTKSMETIRERLL